MKLFDFASLVGRPIARLAEALQAGTWSICYSAGGK
jgi:hypothetical protein